MRRFGLALRSSASVTAPTAGECLVDLLVELIAIGHDHEGPVARDLAQHLLREEDHRVALAAALCMPENAEPTLVLAYCVHRLNSAVYAEDTDGSWRQFC